MTPAQLPRKLETSELSHPMIAQHLALLKQRIDDALSSFAPQIIRIPSPRGVGKSSLITNLSREYPETRANGRRRVSVLIVEVPQSATAKLLTKSVLAALGIQVPGKMTAGSMSEMMITQLRLANTRVVIFDEISHLVDEGSRVQPQVASDWLKALTDALGMTLILFGTTPRLERLFSANQQLCRRAE